MKYKIAINVRATSDSPSPTSFTKTQQDMVDEIARTYSAILRVRLHTPTTIRMDVSCGTISFQCSYIPPGCEHLKFQSKSMRDCWTGEIYEANYLRLTKKQGWPQIMRYGAALVDSLHLNTTETVTLTFSIDANAAEKLNCDEMKPEYYYTNSI